MIFDVGANVGQSARLYRRHYREACIHCFEPVTATYIELCENLKDDRQVITHPMALGASHAEADMVLQGTSDMSRLTEAVPSGLSSDRDATLERVEVTTLDRFCKHHDIAHINYLKIDTEGTDLQVLQGAEATLQARGIDLIEVEAGMNPGNSRHVPFETLKAFLEARGYFVFGIYEQVEEWPTAQPHLRRINTLYVCDRVIGAEG